MLDKENDQSTTALNDTQKNIMEGTLTYIFETISELAPNEAILALRAMTNKNISLEQYQKFIDQGVWQSIVQIRRLLIHPCPQNRSEDSSYPYIEQEKGFAMFKIERNRIKWIHHACLPTAKSIELKNGRIIPAGHILRNSAQDDYIIVKEKAGLLGLTAYEDDNNPYTTDKMVKYYIHQLINNTTKEQQAKLEKSQLELSNVEQGHPKLEIKEYSSMTWYRRAYEKKDTDYYYFRETEKNNRKYAIERMQNQHGENFISILAQKNISYLIKRSCIGSINVALRLTESQMMTLSYDNIVILLEGRHITLDEANQLSEEQVQILNQPTIIFLIKRGILTEDAAMKLSIGQAINLNHIQVYKKIVDGKLSVDEAKQLTQISLLKHSLDIDSDETFKSKKAIIMKPW